MNVIVNTPLMRRETAEKAVREAVRFIEEDCGWNVTIKTFVFASDYLVENDDVLGRYYSREGFILCNPCEGFEQACSTLVHELAHHIHYRDVFGIIPNKPRTWCSYDDPIVKHRYRAWDMETDTARDRVRQFTDFWAIRNYVEMVAEVVQNTYEKGYCPEDVYTVYTNHGGPEMLPHLIGR